MPDGVWLLGLALGLAVDAGLALALALTGYQLAAADLPRLLTSGVSIAVLGTTGLPVVVAAARTGLQGALWWLERRGGPTMPLDGPKTPLPDSRDSEQGNYAIFDAEAQAWRVALDRFFRAGESAGGFSASKLSGVAGSDAWPKLVHFYGSEAGGNVLRDAGGNQGHVWGHGWTIDRVLLALGNGKLPHPDMAVPNIEPYVAVAAQRRAAQKSKTPASRAVIDA